MASRSPPAVGATQIFMVRPCPVQCIDTLHMCSVPDADYNMVAAQWSQAPTPTGKCCCVQELHRVPWMRTRHKDAHAATLLSFGEGGDDFVDALQHLVFQPVRSPAQQEALQSAANTALATGAACLSATSQLPVAPNDPRNNKTHRCARLGRAKHLSTVKLIVKPVDFSDPAFFGGHCACAQLNEEARVSRVQVEDGRRHCQQQHHRQLDLPGSCSRLFSYKEAVHTTAGANLAPGGQKVACPGTSAPALAGALNTMLADLHASPAAVPSRSNFASHRVVDGANE